MLELVAREHLRQRGGGDFAAWENDRRRVDRDVIRHQPGVLGQNARIGRQRDQANAAAFSKHGGSLDEGVRVSGCRGDRYECKRLS
jgi:hypothetical protein